MKRRLQGLTCCLLFVVVYLQAQTVITESIYKTKPYDEEAYYFTSENYGFKSGQADVSEALQKAINQVKIEKNFGVLFIPEGTYNISKTIYIPPAIRLIGYGKSRPEFVLTKNSPCYQKENSAEGGERYNYMFWFTGNLVTEDQQPRDANAGTFYSAISNINFTIEDGNPSAIALRAHFAQHSFVSHSIINAGNGKAGMYDVGNEMENLLFIGGEYGVMANRTSPGWPMMMVDIMFEGQRSAAILANHADLTIVNMEVKDTPIAIEMMEGVSNRIYMEEGYLSNVDKGVVVGVGYNANNQLNIVNTHCDNVRVAVDFFEGEEAIQVGHNRYLIRNITSGLIMNHLNDHSHYGTVTDIVPIQNGHILPTKRIPLLPPVTDWINIKDLGAKGDGMADDTEIIKEAIKKHQNIYFPTGWYRITETIKMRPGTNLIGFHPFATQLVIEESTPSFSGFGSPVPMLESSVGSINIINGIGVSTGGYNYRAVGIKWMAGENSFMNDIKFVGGHGTMRKPNSYTMKQQQGRSSESRLPRISSPTNPVAVHGLDLAWDNQYWSLWVTNGGGGIFKDIWTASTYASAGLYVSNTSTPGYIYAMSVEHHVRYECRLDHVSNWKFYAFQFEEEGREGQDCQPVEIYKCNNLMFANIWFYRTIRVNTPRPYGIKMAESQNIDFRNMRNWTQVLYSTEFTLYDMNKGLMIYPHDFARALVTGTEGGKKVENHIGIAEKLAFGFEFATGAVADSKGNVYFCENRLKKIHKYDAESGSVAVYGDYPWKPFSLAVDTDDNLIVICRYDPQPGYLIDGKQEAFTTPLPDDNPMYSGWGNSGWATLAYTIDPDKPDDMQVLPRVKTAEVKNIKRVIYPTHRWRSDFDAVATSMPQTSFLAADGVTIIPETYDLGRSVQLMAVTPSQPNPVYMSDEDLKVTAKLNVDDRGKLSIIHKDIKRGEYSSVTASDGTLYLAEGQIFVFDSKGKEIRRYNSDERPISMVLGGVNEDILYFTTSTSFYRMRIK